MAMMTQLPELNAFKDIPGYKAILKAVIRSQIQFLVEQLSHQVGEESVLLTASLSDGTLSHLGSESGKVFLERNDDFKSQFLGFCIKRHHTTISRTAVKKKPPTAKRSVPFGFKTKPKRQHTGAYPIGPPETVIQSEHNKHIPEITADLPTSNTVALRTSNAVAETDSLKEPLPQESVLTENVKADNDDAASDKTIENYPVVKTEPIDESDIVDNAEFESSFDTSVSHIDTSITNGEERFSPAKKVKKRNLQPGDQTGLLDNASVVKLEYPGNDFMTNEAEHLADVSQSMQDESASFDYGESSGVITEQQLFFSQADTPKTVAEPTPRIPKFPRRQKFGTRTRYSVQDMTSAINAVRNNLMKKCEASKHFGVPLTTLLDKLSGKSPEVTSYGRNNDKRAVMTAKMSRPKRFYTREAMIEALQAVRMGKMSRKDAAIHYNVPYSTMVDKLCGRSPE